MDSCPVTPATIEMLTGPVVSTTTLDDVSECGGRVTVSYAVRVRVTSTHTARATPSTASAVSVPPTAIQPVRTLLRIGMSLSQTFRNRSTASTRRWSLVGRRQVELGEDVADVLLHRALADHAARSAMPALERPSAISAQHLALPRGQPVQRVAVAAQQQLGDHLGVERGAARRHPAQRVEELGRRRRPGP